MTLAYVAYEGRRRVRGGLALGVGLAFLAGVFVAMFPSVTEGIDLDAYLETLPEAFVVAFGLKSLGTIEGFLAAELYAWGWILLLGLYFAYSAASLIAADVERERIDVLLSLPVSRGWLLGVKFVALLVPILVVNAVVLPVVYAGTLAIGEPVSLARLLAVHALSVPYLVCTAAVGLLFSVLVDRESIAQRLALGVIFGLFMLEAVVAGTDFETVGALAPMRYYDPTAVLVDGTVDLAGSAVLLAATAGLLVASRWYFARRDV